MVYLLVLHFNLSIVGLPYPSKETCDLAATYYHERYKDKLKKTECTLIREEEEND